MLRPQRHALLMTHGRGHNEYELRSAPQPAPRSPPPVSPRSIIRSRDQEHIYDSPPRLRAHNYPSVSFDLTPSTSRGSSIFVDL